jgi:hypothetical protein
MPSLEFASFAVAFLSLLVAIATMIFVGDEYKNLRSVLGGIFFALAIIFGLLGLAAVLPLQQTLSESNSSQSEVPANNSTEKTASTPTPMATIDADPTVYDNFNNPGNDAGFEKKLWRFVTDPPNQASQRDGVLVVSSTNKLGSTDLAARRYDFISFDKPTFFEAKIRFELNDEIGEPGDNAHLHLNTQMPSGESWFTECNIHHVSDLQARSDCWSTTWPMRDGYATQEKKLVDYGTWHKVRIELDPTRMEFRYYVDDQLLDSHIPVDAEVLKGAKFSLIIGISSSENDVTGYFDDVRIGEIGQ